MQRTEINTIQHFLSENPEFTYNQLWELCDKNEINLKEAIKMIAYIKAPEGCKGCKHIGPYLENHLCLSCARNHEDHYEKDSCYKEDEEG